MASSRLISTGAGWPATSSSEGTAQAMPDRPSERTRIAVVVRMRCLLEKELGKRPGENLSYKTRSVRIFYGLPMNTNIPRSKFRR